MKKRLLLTLLLVLTCVLVLSSCGSVEVTWLDADGTLIFMEEISKSEEIPQRDLPSDSDEWHYIKWRQVVSTEKSVTYIADRVANQKATWKDADGNVLEVKSIPAGEKIPERALPADTDKWHYTEWSETHEGNEYTYVAQRELREDYFVGNVFQIIIKDLAGTPLGTGTGFVFNKDGWFITNAHVMEDAYQAVAIFEIKDSATGESFTTLEIKNGSYVHYDKDIFIGKIDGYSKIATHYNDIPFQSEHSVGDVTYSVGYPNSSVSMEIHEGEIKEDLSFLYDKLYSGISYIASDSYIAPGSSGGILINENAEVIGMTTLGWFDDDDNFELGAAIEAYNYINLTSDVKNSDLKDIAFFLHPDEETFIKFFRGFTNWTNTKKIVDDDMVYHMHIWEGEDINDDGYAYSYEERLCVFADGLISYNNDYYWDDGGHREEAFYGFYSSEDGLDNLSYELKYTFENGKWYTIESDNINYSENLNLTLRDYTKASSYNYTASSHNIQYARKCFNSIYKWLYDLIEEYK